MKPIFLIEAVGVVCVEPPELNIRKIGATNDSFHQAFAQTHAPMDFEDKDIHDVGKYGVIGDDPREPDRPPFLVQNRETAGMVNCLLDGF
jgi:hypothetical protein